MQFNWSPGIGDPSPLGWLTVFLYAVAALVCLHLSRRCSAREVELERRVWAGLAVLLLLLGINKQLDLQSAFTEIGRIIARVGGWYGSRRRVQLLFVVILAMAGVSVAFVAFHRARAADIHPRVALAGAALLLGFVLIRAASFHHVDVFISSRLLGFRWNWILEIGGICVIIAAGLHRLRTRSAGPLR